MVRGLEIGGILSELLTDALKPTQEHVGVAGAVGRKAGVEAGIEAGGEAGSKATPAGGEAGGGGVKRPSTDYNERVSGWFVG